MQTMKGKTFTGEANIFPGQYLPTTPIHTPTAGVGNTPGNEAMHQ